MLRGLALSPTPGVRIDQIRRPPVKGVYRATQSRDFRFLDTVMGIYRWLPTGLSVGTISSAYS